MKEVLFFSQGLLAYVSADTFQRYRDFKYERLREKIELCIENYSKFKEKFLKHSCLYDSEDACGEYLKVFEILRQ